MIVDWLDEITADCPKKSAHNMNDQCGRGVRICRECRKSHFDVRFTPKSGHVRCN
jgi:hypothetical protein